MSDGLSFRSLSDSDRSGEVLVPFSARWRDRLVKNEIKCVLRRRYPTSFRPERIYIYLASPRSEIVGHFTLRTLKSVKLDEAMSLLSESCLTADQVKEYFEGYECVGCYEVEEMTFLTDPIHMLTIREKFRFFPPQSFVSLSRDASAWIAEHEAYAHSTGGVGIYS